MGAFSDLSDQPPKVQQKWTMDSRVDVAKQKQADAEAAWRAVCKVVDTRDGKACRCCDKRSDPEATGLLKRGHRHHLVYRSAGGKDESFNICTLCCAGCHSDEHHNKLLITSARGGSFADADGPLQFWRKDDAGVWYIEREEIAVRVVRRD